MIILLSWSPVLVEPKFSNCQKKSILLPATDLATSLDKFRPSEFSTKTPNPPPTETTIYMVKYMVQSTSDLIFINIFRAQLTKMTTVELLVPSDIL